MGRPDTTTCRGVSGGPEAAGEPVGIHLPHLNAHNVLYRGVDGSLRLIWWVGAEPAQSVDLCAAAGAPAAVSDGDLWFCHRTAPFTLPTSGKADHCTRSNGLRGPQTWTDLTRVALAPASPSRPPEWLLCPGCCHETGCLRGCRWSGSTRSAGAKAAPSRAAVRDERAWQCQPQLAHTTDAPGRRALLWGWLNGSESAPQVRPS